MHLHSIPISICTLVLASYFSVEQWLKNRAPVQWWVGSIKASHCGSLCLVKMKAIRIAGATWRESLYTSAALSVAMLLLEVRVFWEHFPASLQLAMFPFHLCVFIFPKWTNYNCLSKFTSTLKSLELLHLSTSFFAVNILSWGGGVLWECSSFLAFLLP